MGLKILGGEIGKELINILEEFEVGLKPGAYRFGKSCDTQTPLFKQKEVLARCPLCNTADSVSRKDI
jgi:hypothetical protein